VPDLLRRAGAAMCRAKASGRARLQSYAPGIDTGLAPASAVGG